MDTTAGCTQNLVIALELVSEHQPQQLNTNAPWSVGTAVITLNISPSRQVCLGAVQRLSCLTVNRFTTNRTLTNGMFTDQSRPMLTKQN